MVIQIHYELSASQELIMLFIKFQKLFIHSPHIIKHHLHYLLSILQLSTQACNFGFQLPGLVVMVCVCWSEAQLLKGLLILSLYLIDLFLEIKFELFYFELFDLNNFNQLVVFSLAIPNLFFKSLFQVKYGIILIFFPLFFISA